MAKIRNANYALSQIKSYYNFLEDSDSNTELKVNDTLHFYVESFFTFLFSSLDVVAQVINQKYYKGDERSVSFKQIYSKLAQTQSSTPLYTSIKKLIDSNYFEDLEKYRNCSIHRRQIYIKSETTYVRVEETEGYASTANFNIVDNIKRTLCDNPYDIKPKIKQNRELIIYSEKLNKKILKEITTIIKNI